MSRELNDLRIIRDYLRYEDVSVESMAKMISGLLPEVIEEFIESRVQMFLIYREETNLDEVSQLVDEIVDDVKSYRDND